MQIVNRAGRNRIERFGAHDVRHFRFVAERVRAFDGDEICRIRRQTGNRERIPRSGDGREHVVRHVRGVLPIFHKFQVRRDANQLFRGLPLIFVVAARRPRNANPIFSGVFHRQVKNRRRRRGIEFRHGQHVRDGGQIAEFVHGAQRKIIRRASRRVFEEKCFERFWRGRFREILDRHGHIPRGVRYRLKRIAHFVAADADRLFAKLLLRGCPRQRHAIFSQFFDG